MTENFKNITCESVHEVLDELRERLDAIEEEIEAQTGRHYDNIEEANAECVSRRLQAARDRRRISELAGSVFSLQAEVERIKGQRDTLLDGIHTITKTDYRDGFKMYQTALATYRQVVGHKEE